MINFGEKAALDAYHDFCALQQGLIGQLVTLVGTLSNPQVAFSIKPPAKTEMQEDLEHMKNNPVDPAYMQSLLEEAGFHSANVDTF
jgi:hypothetical protein